jgi:hypothetical protein
VEVSVKPYMFGRKPYNRIANSKVHMPTYLGPYPSLRL